MAVYVDDASIPADVTNGHRVHKSQWSHLMAGSEAELVAFARRIGLRPQWIQHPGTPRVHFDVTAGKRQQALAHGAQPITWREAGEMVMARSQTGAEVQPAPQQQQLVLLTSSRDGLTEQDVEAALRPVFAPDKILLSGHARGGDQTGGRLWRGWGGELWSRPVHPQRRTRRRGAGYARNAAMVAEMVRHGGGECVAVIAGCAHPRCGREGPPGTHGTTHCAGLANDAGLTMHWHKAGATEAQPGQQPEPVNPGRNRAHEPPAAKPGRAPRTKPCDTPSVDCGQPGRLCPAGWRCDDHQPEPAWRVMYDPEPPRPRGGTCPDCGTAALAGGALRCQACGAAAAMKERPAHRAPEQQKGDREMGENQQSGGRLLEGAARDAEIGRLAEQYPKPDFGNPACAGRGGQPPGPAGTLVLTHQDHPGRPMTLGVPVTQDAEQMAETWRQMGFTVYRDMADATGRVQVLRNQQAQATWVAAQADIPRHDAEAAGRGGELARTRSRQLGTPNLDDPACVEPDCRRQREAELEAGA